MESMLLRVKAELIGFSYILTNFIINLRGKIFLMLAEESFKNDSK